MVVDDPARLGPTLCGRQLAWCPTGEGVEGSVPEAEAPDESQLGSSSGARVVLRCHVDPNECGLVVGVFGGSGGGLPLRADQRRVPRSRFHPAPRLCREICRRARARWIRLPVGVAGRWPETAHWCSPIKRPTTGSHHGPRLPSVRDPRPAQESDPEAGDEPGRDDRRVDRQADEPESDRAKPGKRGRADLPRRWSTRGSASCAWTHWSES